MLFPIIDLMSPENCYQWLLDNLHPDGLKCPYCRSQERWVHRRDREPLMDYRCKNCHKTYNLFSKTDFEKSHLNLTQIVLLMRGVCKGDTANTMAEEIGVSRQTIQNRRQRIQQRAYESLPQEALADKETETDEMFANAGEKKHSSY
jgi:transposase-like protein